MIAVNLLILTQITIIIVLCDEEIEQDFDNHQKYIFHKDRKEKHRRVLGGSPAPATGFSFAVGLLDRTKSTFCSGSIISPTFVLTAAHCSDMFYVHKAIKDNKSGQLNVYEAKEFYPHPRFHYTTGPTGIDKLQNDIALLETKDSMVQGWVQAIPLSTATMKNAEGNLGTIAGFGSRGMFAGPDLRNLQFTDIELEACPKGWTITICGRTPSDIRTTRALCGGDSGGPMVYEDKLLGINSIGPSICTSFLPQDSQSAFTLVSAYVPWIHSEMSKRIGRASLESVFVFTISPISIFEAHANKSITNHESENLKNSVFQDKIIYQDVYYSKEKSISGASAIVYYVVLFSILARFL